MAGLLYKDFVSVKGKKLCLGYLIYLFVISVLRIVFAGYHEVDEFIVTTERGQTVNLLDAFFLCASAILLIMGACYINLFVQKIVEDDQKNKVMNYMKSMPFEKTTYVASKYVFILICAYVSFTMYTICSIICKAFAKAGVMQDFQDAINTMVLPLIMLALFSAAVELPLFACSTVSLIFVKFLKDFYDFITSAINTIVHHNEIIILSFFHFGFRFR